MLCVFKGVLEGGKFTTDKGSDDSSESDDSSDDDGDSMRTKGKIVDITDEALFKACGGMTGHKGARHGINMSAKLARIKKQEQAGMDALNKSREIAAIKSGKTVYTAPVYPEPVFVTLDTDSGHHSPKTGNYICKCKKSDI